MWRKALQVCKTKLLLIYTSLFLAGNIYAQSIDMPSMPEMPAMPTISMDGSFYTPTVPGNINNKKENTKEKKENSQNNDAVITNATTPDSILNSLMSNNALLSASDISSLYDSGLFSDVSSLNTNLATSNYATTSTTNILLQQVLNSLNELKQEQKKASPESQNALQDVQADSNTFKKRQPEILRFKINGYNIKDSLKTIFFSDTEPDGTFLLTADRKYFSGQRQMTETFYILFKTVSSNGSSVTYKVMPSIVQNEKNENSFVYRFAEAKNLTAEKTGNLVVMHFTDSNLNVDLLLDIDRK